MLPVTVKTANMLYRSGDYRGALGVYQELTLKIGYKNFYANIALCLNKLNADGVSVNPACVDLASKKWFDFKSEFCSAEIVVSLTSYPARIATVVETIKSILAQSFRPWKLVLWLAREQFPNQERDLPPQLVKLKGEGLVIEWCEDIKSYKKLIPSLKAYPGKTIVTADDDIIYSRNWLAQLVMSHIREPDVIICHRAHQVLLNEQGGVAPYKFWLRGVGSEKPSFLYFFTGVGGVLYPPGSLHEAVLDRDVFLRICPTGDDLWFWGMALLKGSKILPVKDSSFKLDFVSGTQDTAMWRENYSRGANDSMLGALNARYPEILRRVTESEKSNASPAPKVSIIIPVFNTGAYLAECLASVTNQTFNDFEVLCIDDGTTNDITRNILSDYSRKDPRIRVFWQPNSGPATARNHGLKNARGLYIAFIDSDDYISEGYIGGLYKCAQRYGVDIAIAEKILCVYERRQSKEKRSGLEDLVVGDPKRTAAQAILTTGVSWNKLYRKNYLSMNGIEYLEGMKCQSEDNYFTILAIAFGYKSMAIAENTTYFYRQHESGITKNVTAKSFGKSILVYETIRKKISQLDINDKQYWLNVINQRALNDLKFTSRNLPDRASFSRSLHKNFVSKIFICCIADENYIVPTLVFLESVKRTKQPATHSVITVLVQEGTRAKMEIFERMSSADFFVRVLEVDATQFLGLHKYHEKDNFCMASRSAMFKFIIPNLFPDLDRILYLDTDLIVRKDLLELFMNSMDDKYLCAVPDLWQSVTDRIKRKKFKSYFNSGVMLMNLAKMRIEKLPAKLIETKRKSKNFDLMDQDVFNEVCNEHTKMLDIRYNFLPVCYERHKYKLNVNTLNALYRSNYIEIDEIAADPVVAHWAGSDKPWVSQSTLFQNEWVEIYTSLKKGIVGLVIPSRRRTALPKFSEIA